MPRLPDRLPAGPVELHRWTLDRLDDLMAAIDASLPELQVWMPWANPAPTREAEAAALDSGRATFDADHEWQYFLVESETGELVGGCGLMRRAGPDTLEIGYWVRSDRTRRGYATAAARALMDAVFANLPEIERVEIHMDKANAASAAVPPKLAFDFVGEETRDRLAPGHTGVGMIWVRDREADVLRGVSGLNFDRAAGFYDATRGLPESAIQAVTGMLAAEVEGRGLCLEIGVGTGRIALPLHARGVPLVGADIAAAMMRQLVANAGGRAPFPLILADAARLPFPDASFGAVLASHVLHLISGWPAVVDEARRTLRPDGVLLVDFGGGAPAPWSPWSGQVMSDIGVTHVRPGVSIPEDVTAHLPPGTPVWALAPVTMTATRRLEQDLDEWGRQIHSWTWFYDTATIAVAVAEVRAEADRRGWPLDREVELTRQIQWWAFGGR
jgi:RimJ/RimL family protein N-acetyltransferase/SAM-dependent methyltransferase